MPKEAISAQIKEESDVKLLVKQVTLFELFREGVQWFKMSDAMTAVFLENILIDLS